MRANTRVLIAGGGGYIGSALTQLLLDQGYSVRVLDRFFFGSRAHDSFREHGRYERVHSDIRWVEESVFAGVDCVVDLAGLSNDPSCALRPELTQSINLDGAIRFASGAKKNGVRRYIYSSSCSVYGAGGDELLCETSACKPLSLYAKYKLDIEDYALNFLADDGFCSTVLRNGTVYGVSPRMRFDLLLNVMTARAHQTRKIFVNGGGEQWRPLVHVRDACRAFLATLEAPREKVSRQIFNVGSNEQNFRVISVARRIREAIPEAELISVPEDADLRSYRVDFGKIRAALGFEVRESIADSIREIRAGVEAGELRFTGTDDDPTCTTLHYRSLTKDNPFLDDPAAAKPASPKRIEFYKHNIDEVDIARAVHTLRSVFLTTGDQTDLFEKRFANYLGVKRVIGTASCTQSLFLSLTALEVHAGDEVIAPTLSFLATANAILQTGAKPVFVDSDPRTGNLDLEQVERAITPRTRAILPVHLYGQPCDMRALTKLAQTHRLRVIEDAAHCIEGTRDGVRPGQLSEAACFSFYATKNITCGEGGAIATNDEALADRLLRLRLHGMGLGAAKRYSSPFQHFDMECLGYKANMSNISASLLIGQLSRIEQLLERREKIAQTYTQALRDLPYFEHPMVLANTRHARHLFTVWTPPRHRDAIAQHLKSNGIGVAVNFRPIHLSSFYSAKYGYKRGDFPVAESIGDRTLSIPLYPQLSDADTQAVIAALRELPERFPAP